MTGPLIPMERATGFEPATSTLARWRATNCAKPATQGVMIWLLPADCKARLGKVFRRPSFSPAWREGRAARTQKRAPRGVPVTSWRRSPDSNRGSGLCRPVPYHLATSPYEKGRTHPALKLAWSGLRGSNPRPPPWQGGALPTALSPQAQGLLYGAGPADARGQISIRGGIVNPHGRRGRRVTPRGAARPRARIPGSRAA